MDIITSIQNGDEEILFYLTDKYYPSARRWMRRHGCRDADTPQVFGKVLLQVYREIRSQRISKHVDFNNLFYNSLKDFLGREHSVEPGKEPEQPGELNVVANCFSILDESARRLLAERYAEERTFEEMAVSQNYSNPAIAEFELNKAYEQYEKIVRARLKLDN
jgi:hypothetical protein